MATPIQSLSAIPGFMLERVEPQPLPFTDEPPMTRFWLSGSPSQRLKAIENPKFGYATLKMQVAHPGEIGDCHCGVNMQWLIDTKAEDVELLCRAIKFGANLPVYAKERTWEVGMIKENYAGIFITTPTQTNYIGVVENYQKLSVATLAKAIAEAYRKQGIPAAFTNVFDMAHMSLMGISVQFNTETGNFIPCIIPHVQFRVPDNQAEGPDNTRLHRASICSAASQETSVTDMSDSSSWAPPSPGMENFYYNMAHGR